LIAIPNEHYASIDMQTEEGSMIFGKIIYKISTLQEKLGLQDA